MFDTRVLWPFSKYYAHGYVSLPPNNHTSNGSRNYVIFIPHPFTYLYRSEYQKYMRTGKELIQASKEFTAENRLRSWLELIITILPTVLSLVMIFSSQVP